VHTSVPTNSNWSQSISIDLSVQSYVEEWIKETGGGDAPDAEAGALLVSREEMMPKLKDNTGTPSKKDLYKNASKVEEKRKAVEKRKREEAEEEGSDGDFEIEGEGGQ